MKRYFLLCCILININLTAHDANDQSAEKLPEMLQRLEPQIKEAQKVVYLQSNLTPIVLGMSAAFSMLSFNKDPFYSSIGKVSVVTLLLSFFTLHFQLPKEQRKLDTLESERAELVQKLKEKEAQ